MPNEPLNCADRSAATWQLNYVLESRPLWWIAYVPAAADGCSAAGARAGARAPGWSCGVAYLPVDQSSDSKGVNMSLQGLLYVMSHIDIPSRKTEVTGADGNTFDVCVMLFAASAGRPSCKLSHTLASDAQHSWPFTAAEHIEEISIYMSD